jgi:predicted ArsR family transcriptional regulator
MPTGSSTPVNVSQIGSSRPTLTVKQRELVEALLVHGDAKAAYEAVEVSRSTAYRWMGLPAFAAALRDAERELLTATSRRLARLGIKAVQVLDDTLGDPDAPAAIRVRAADAVLTKLLQIRESVDLDERLAALEAVMEERS